MDMQTIVADWKANAERHSEQNFAFLRSLKMKNERAVDRAARELHDEAFTIIDCTRCANCCRPSCRSSSRKTSTELPSTWEFRKQTSRRGT